MTSSFHCNHELPSAPNPHQLHSRERKLTRALRDSLKGSCAGMLPGELGVEAGDRVRRR